jgi:hypothetical protein
MVWSDTLTPSLFRPRWVYVKIGLGVGGHMSATCRLVEREREGRRHTSKYSSHDSSGRSPCGGCRSTRPRHV